MHILIAKSQTPTENGFKFMGISVKIELEETNQELNLQKWMENVRSVKFYVTIKIERNVHRESR